MFSDKRFLKRFLSGFIACICVSALIAGIPKLVQAHFYSVSSNDYTQSTSVQDTSRTNNQSRSGDGNIFDPDLTNFFISLTTPDKEFITKVAQNDITETKMSQLLLQRSKNKAVTDFAQKMIKEHTDSNKELMDIANSKGFKLLNDISSDDKSLLDNFRLLDRQSFNRAYMQVQVQSHSKIQAEIQKYLEQGQDASLKAFADKILPVIAEHLQMAQKIVARL
ncbi:MAG: DUF4142 domain-containing protein [Nostoc sp. DedQUE01]|nr:DUF4142 domain-containing protein [Nostoc sp. DedQUE01]